MSRAGETGEGERPSSSSTRSQPGRNNAPLVIVSERGRHSDESRRIVRAQAARASAAQSRVTRARNREGRESGQRETPLASPTTEEQPSVVAAEQNQGSSIAGAFTNPFGNPFSKGPHQAPAPAPPQPSQPVAQEGAKNSCLGAIGTSLATPFGRGGESQQAPLPAPPPPAPSTHAAAEENINSPTQTGPNTVTIPFSTFTQKPLVIWAAALLNMSAANLFENLQSMPVALGHTTLTGATTALSAGGAFAGSAYGTLSSVPGSLGPPSVAGATNALSAGGSAIGSLGQFGLTGATNAGTFAGGALGTVGQTGLSGATNAGAFASGAVGSLAGAIQDTGGGFGRIFSTATGASQGSGGYGSAMPGSISTPGSGKNDPGVLQLPRALPRGFATLAQRINMSDPLLGLLTRTSCFDFGSPGVEMRIHRLLFDLIIGCLTAAFSPFTQPSHPIQGHLRIACTCLTIFQGQRANGAVLAEEPTYDKGLEAAWSEVKLLDQNVLADFKSAEASLWAVFIISVTTGQAASTADFFHRLLQGLCADLQLQYWSQVRNVLLDFIYPVSFLDEPCKAFWDKVQALPRTMVT